MYFNVNFNVFFKIKIVHLLVGELYIYQKGRCNNKKIIIDVTNNTRVTDAPTVCINTPQFFYHIKTVSYSANPWILQPLLQTYHIYVAYTYVPLS